MERKRQIEKLRPSCPRDGLDGYRDAENPIRRWKAISFRRSTMERSQARPSNSPLNATASFRVASKLASSRGLLDGDGRISRIGHPRCQSAHAHDRLHSAVVPLRANRDPPGDRSPMRPVLEFQDVENSWQHLATARSTRSNDRCAVGRGLCPGLLLRKSEEPCERIAHDAAMCDDGCRHLRSCLRAMAQLQRQFLP